MANTLTDSELQKTNGLGDWLSERVVYLGRQTINFFADRAVNVVTDKIVNVLDGDELPDFAIAQAGLGMCQ